VYRSDHRFAGILVIVVLSFLPSCAGDDGELVGPGPPIAPVVVGLNSTTPGGTLTMCATTPDGGPDIEYQFDFRVGENNGLTGWSSNQCQSHSWAFEGRYTVRARARRGDLTSAWSGDWIVVVIDESVWPPDGPTSDGLVVVGTNIRFCASGAFSDRNHPIEYRFRVDPDIEFDWHIDACSSHPWLVPGVFRVRAQARCVLHNGNMSAWSQSVAFNAVSGADTRLVRVFNGLSPGATATTEINFSDALPDTVPFGDWVTFVVEGSNPDYTVPTTCSDPVNRCIKFQFRYERSRATAVNGFFESSWLPLQPFDSNPAGLTDTLRMNAGSVDYNLFFRALDEFAGDAEPAEASIVGNFSPILDDYFIEDSDGAKIRHGDTLRIDWWNPVNSDTVDVSSNQRKKRFSFTIVGYGHDDARDPAGSAVAGWRYLFIDGDNGVLLYDIGRAGEWVESLKADTLRDAFVWEVRYPLDDINGDAVFDDLPEWANRLCDYSLRGRDAGLAETFEQKVLIGGETTIVNDYGIWDYGRRTEAGFQRFFIEVAR